MLSTESCPRHSLHFAQRNVCAFAKLAVTTIVAVALNVGSAKSSQADEGDASNKRQKTSTELDPHSGKLPLVFSEDFEKGAKRWTTTDRKAWRLRKEDDGNRVFGLKVRISEYEPKFRSPHNIALIKDVKLTDFVLTYRVKSTKDTGGHRDCCTFFCHQDPEHFYYIHLGARPDPHSGQIMIVDGAPRVALTENEKQVAWDDDWHTVKVVRDAKSGTIEVFFDDMDSAHMKVENTKFQKGSIGIGSFDDMNDFDDIKLYGK